MPVSTETPRRARASNRPGAAYKKRTTATFGTSRFPANTGGPIDLLPVDGMYIQVKGGKAVTTAVMRDGMAKARAAAALHDGLPCVYLVDARGTRLEEWVCFPAKEFAAWHGYGLAKEPVCE